MENHASLQSHPMQVEAPINQAKELLSASQLSDSEMQEVSKLNPTAELSTAACTEGIKLSEMESEKHSFEVSKTNRFFVGGEKYSCDPLINSNFNSHSEFHLDPETTPRVFELEDNELPIYRGCVVQTMSYPRPQPQHMPYKRLPGVPNAETLENIRQELQDIVFKKIKLDNGESVNFQNILNASPQSLMSMIKQIQLQSNGQLDSMLDQASNSILLPQYMENFRSQTESTAQKGDKAVLSFKNFIKNTSNWFISCGFSKQGSTALDKLLEEHKISREEFLEKLTECKEVHTIKEFKKMCYEKEHSHIYRSLFIDFLEHSFYGRLKKSRVASDLHQSYMKTRDMLIARLKTNDASQLNHLK